MGIFHAAPASVRFLPFFSAFPNGFLSAYAFIYLFFQLCNALFAQQTNGQFH